MVSDGLAVRPRAHSAGLFQAAACLEDEVWEPLGFLSRTEAHQRYYSGIIETHADLQLCLVDEATDEPLALVNCVPFRFSGDLSTLPDEGWDWLVETGGRGASDANVLGALAVSVPERHRGKGYAQRMIRALKDVAVGRGFEALVVPVRPSMKCRHQGVAMRDYMLWQDDKGRAYDPWLRSHVAQGAEIIRACERSMVVEENVAFWEEWAGRRFETSGSHALSGGLVPVQIDLAAQTGRYEEPNVWVRYRI